MTRLELLAGQLSQEALTPELQAPQKTFQLNLNFWKLCVECRRIVNEEKRLGIIAQKKAVTNDTNK